MKRFVSVATTILQVPWPSSRKTDLYHLPALSLHLPELSSPPILQHAEILLKPPQPPRVRLRSLRHPPANLLSLSLQKDPLLPPRRPHALSRSRHRPRRRRPSTSPEFQAPHSRRPVGGHAGRSAPAQPRESTYKLRLLGGRVSAFHQGWGS